MIIKKKSGLLQPFDPSKIVAAIRLSADRVQIQLSQNDCQLVTDYVERSISGREEIPICDIHNLVELALDQVNPLVAKSYRDYRNYKQDFTKMFDEIYCKDQSLRFLGDVENANKDSTLVATKRSLLCSFTNKEFYKKFFMRQDWKEATDAGYIYIHDMDARRDTMNCCLFDMQTVLSGGFNMANIWYNEPKSLDVAGDVIGDIVLSAASQQYGGFTVPEVDKLLAPYAKKSYEKYLADYKEIAGEGADSILAKEWALKKTRKEMEQVFQGWEYKFNTVASSRGDYPFITMTFGLATDPFEKMASETVLKVRMNGQGAPGKKKPVLFPKLVFLYDDKLHGKGAPMEDLFNLGVLCSSKTMYPDWLSLSGEGYISRMYKEYGQVISPMGCRAFLSPWWERGGLYKADEKDKPVYVGRFNIGVVSLNLPMILAKARLDGKDFYEVLDYYLQMIREIHLATYEYLGEMRAASNPLAYCEGGFWGGHLNPNDKIAPLLDSATASFGITALNELQQLYNKKSLVEDGAFALEVLTYINKAVEKFKQEDGRLYAVYGTPAENLCGVQVEQFRKLYGIVENVSDRLYVSNSFHCHVSEDIDPLKKQDLEHRFWELCNGGKIQYVKYPIDYNLDAISTLIRRAMRMGFYEGVNLSLSYCNDCGLHSVELDNADTCPCCGSKSVTVIERMNGYLAYRTVSERMSDGTYRQRSRLSAPKLAEIKDRRSM